MCNVNLIESGIILASFKRLPVGPVLTGSRTYYVVHCLIHRPERSGAASIIADFPRRHVVINETVTWIFFREGGSCVREPSSSIGADAPPPPLSCTYAAGPPAVLPRQRGTKKRRRRRRRNCCFHQAAPARRSPNPSSFTLGS